MPMDWEEVFSSTNEQLEGFAPMKALADLFGVKTILVAAAFLAFALGFLLFGVGGSFVCNLVGFVYPAFESFKALEEEDEAASRTWLTYWVVFASFTLLEVFIDYILFWVPLYYILKLGFLVWLFLPATQGAPKVFKLVVAPVLRRHRESIDGAVGAAIREVKRGGSEFVNATQDTKKKNLGGGGGDTTSKLQSRDRSPGHREVMQKKGEEEKTD